MWRLILVEVSGDSSVEEVVGRYLYEIAHDFDAAFKALFCGLLCRGIDEEAGDVEVAGSEDYIGVGFRAFLCEFLGCIEQLLVEEDCEVVFVIHCCCCFSGFN